ncbi:protein phosphatase 2C 51 [Ricinus communis]|uniref:protein-serine/threonine phosphatase n=1 Tax=Ricinus communis TaxID=3988 RepID=B9RIK1_RICCO|nr:protein phosphatase 2C 51 [Ricinus communis]EEF48973.1 protein phosphatase 2c, putative [Ricinus communis]|eukprot:XP_002513570.1 probable protein phosphatase 2C 51 [Ricinus communis]
MNQLTVIKTINSRRRRLKIRRLKYTCQAKKDAVVQEAKTTSDCSAEISLSCKNEVVLSGYKRDELLERNDEEEGDLQRFAGMSYGSISVIGRRREMEDAVKVELGFTEKGGESYDFFGVYDGHGGARVAEACKERLHRVLEEVIVEEEDGKSHKGRTIEWEKVMEECFKRMDEEVEKDRMVGSTAVVAVVGRDELVVANCGDSRAVLCRGGVAVPLSVDHKPDRPDELERVEAAGGRIINWNGHRVLGVLATSRSIGDQYLKPFVISKPEVTVNKRTEKDEFLILASDGLWDVISNEVACQVGRRCLMGRMRRKSQEVSSEGRAAEAAAILVELAIAGGSKDNISVIVVELK